MGQHSGLEILGSTFVICASLRGAQPAAGAAVHIRRPPPPSAGLCRPRRCGAWTLSTKTRSPWQCCSTLTPPSPSPP